jgi:protoheme IX farnesyltransferase
MTTRFVSSVVFSDKKIDVIFDLFSLTKPRLSSLVIFTCALGLFLAPGEISLWRAILSVGATSGLVAGACMINCWMEKDIDALMERTKNRPLPSGRLNPILAVSVGVSLVILCLVLLYSFINPLTGTLGLIATLTYVFLYTPMKKISSWALFAGAIPGAIPPLMGWTTMTNSIGDLGIVLFAILFIWQLPHFLSISMYHAKDYNNANFKIFPTQIGIRKTIHHISIYTLGLLLVSLVPYYMGVSNSSYRNFMFFLGGGFLLLALMGYQKKENSNELLVWSRHYFYASLIYLPCVFLALIFFK